MTNRPISHRLVKVHYLDTALTTLAYNIMATLGGNNSTEGQSERGRRKSAPSQRVRDKTLQDREKAQQNQNRALASAARAETRRQNAVHDPSQDEIHAYVSHPEQQAVRQAANLARYQEQLSSNRLNTLRTDQRGVHTNQVALQMHQSRRTMEGQAMNAAQPQGQANASPNNVSFGPVTRAEPDLTEALVAAVQETFTASAPNHYAHSAASESPLPPPPRAQNLVRYTPYASAFSNASQISMPTRATHPKIPSIPRPLNRKEKKQKSNKNRLTLNKLKDSGDNRPRSKAIEYYSSYLIAKDPLGLLPDGHWGTLAMRDACQELKLEVELQPTKQELKLMTGRHSNIRKPYIDAARKYVPLFYQFWSVLGDQDTEKMHHNEQNVRHLLFEANFAHGDHRLPAGNSPYMSRIFYVLLKECAFGHLQACGVRHGKIWAHATLEFMAFLATVVEKVLREWSTGVSIETSFQAEAYKSMYSDHLEKLQDMRSECAPAMDLYCSGLVKNARAALGSGPDLSQAPKSGVSSASISLWAERRAPALIAGPSVSTHSGNQTNNSFAFDQLQSTFPQTESSTYTTETSQIGEYGGDKATDSLEEILAGSQHESLVSAFSASQAVGYPSLDNYDPSMFNFGIHPSTSEGEPDPSTFAPVHDYVNPDTQTESEVDSYVTLRPSQSVSQVFNLHSTEDRATSPSDDFDDQCALWHAGWVGSRSISQDHAEEFSISATVNYAFKGTISHSPAYYQASMIFQNISAWISTENDENLSEYETKQVDDTTIECWIPSIEAMNFRIRADIPTDVRPSFAVNCRLQLDGINYTGRTLLGVLRGLGQRNVLIRGQNTGPSTARLFQFGKRILTDDGDVSPDVNGLQELNTVRVLFQWGFSSNPQPQTQFFVPKEHGPIHEKVAKKGHAGSAGLGNTTVAISGRHMGCRFLPLPGAKPLVFIFRYAPKDWLLAREIIPPAGPSSQKRKRENSPEVIDVDDLDDLETDDDEVQIIKHLAPIPIAVANKRRKIKDEHNTKPKLEL